MTRRVMVLIGALATFVCFFFAGIDLGSFAIDGKVSSLGTAMWCSACGLVFLPVWLRA